MLASPPPRAFIHPSRHLRSVVTSSLARVRPLLGPTRTAYLGVAAFAEPCASRRGKGARGGDGGQGRGGARGEGRGSCLQPANQDSGRARWEVNGARPAPAGSSSSGLVQRFQKVVAAGHGRRPSVRRRTRMNGPAGLAHLDRRERVLKLGESFEKQPRCAFHTVRCECGLSGVPRGSNLLRWE